MGKERVKSKGTIWWWEMKKELLTGHCRFTNDYYGYLYVSAYYDGIFKITSAETAAGAQRYTA